VGTGSGAIKKKRTLTKANQRKLYVFCDEAGNSGPNLIDLSQPVYVISGWAVRPGRLGDAEAAVAGFRQNIRSRATELKSARLLSQPRAQAAYGDLIRSMANSSWPVFAVFEKRYWISGKIVEKLLDPMYNKRSSWDFFDDIDMKMDLANRISAWPWEYLEAFATAMRSSDPVRLRQVTESLVRLANLTDETELATILLGALENLPYIYEREFIQRDEQSRLLEPMNVSSLMALVQVLETMGQDFPDTEIEIIHDDSLEFEAGYQSAFDWFRRGMDPRLVAMRPDFSPKLENVTSLKMASSAETPLLQAADLLAGGIYRYSRAAAMGEEIPTWLADALTLPLFGSLAAVDGGTADAGHLMGSNRFLHALLKPVGESDTLTPGVS
jgi:hypothetical protein